jgi:hypothetical protein
MAAKMHKRRKNQPLMNTDLPAAKSHKRRKNAVEFETARADARPTIRHLSAKLWANYFRFLLSAFRFSF